MSERPVFDLLVIGGGINGTGIARDAAGRGLRVLLCEKGDLGEGTSSRSSKLIHGGLRYLEHGEFRLVREALIEREVLLRAAPHLVRPMRFVLPHGRGQRPAWMIRVGLFLYDHLGRRRRLPRTRRLDLRRVPEGEPIQDEYRTGFEYSDCWVDDARLVVLNALGAAALGAEVLVRTEVTVARREGTLWRATLRSEDGAECEIRARALANAAGPWVEQVIQGVLGFRAARKLRLVKGSHLVVRKFWDGPQAYLLQNDDGRVIFVSPFEGDLCLIGTTELPYDGAPESAAVSPAERAYLLRVVNRTMRHQLREGDIRHEVAGVRPLHDNGAAKDAAAVTRDYAFEVDAPEGQAPVLCVFGGKITTYRKLAERALEALRPHLPGMGGAWTEAAPLPGGDMPGADFDAFFAGFRRRHPWLPGPLATHYARLYGTRADALLADARGMADLGRPFGALLYAREAEFLRETEWARTPEDVLERRTKHGLHMTPAERCAFAAWMGGADTGRGAIALHASR